jgi:hypothetical protein
VGPRVAKHPGVRLLTLALALLSGACVLLPPSHTELGTALSIGKREGAVTHVATGVHLASAVDAPYDLGVGYTADLDCCGVQAQGMYLEYSARQRQRGNLRTSIGGRGVIFFDDGEVGAGAFARAGVELYTTAKGGFVESSGRGFAAGAVAGAFAVGLYVEAGYEHLPDGARAFLATAGITVRLPAIAALVLASR